MQVAIKEAVSPPGWERSVKRMKRNPRITNPWAMAWWMKGRGYSPRAELQGIQVTVGR